MALPPPWVAVYEAGTREGLPAKMFGDFSKQDARDLVYALEAAGWRIVPSYAVDESRLPRVTFDRECYSRCLRSEGRSLT